jgi:hypothetical protein
MTNTRDLDLLGLFSELLPEGSITVGCMIWVGN